MSHGHTGLAPMIGALAVISALAVLGCSGPPCVNEVVRGLPSPDAADIAFVFHRACGNVPGTDTNVSVIGLHSSLRAGPGNVLIVGDDQPVKVTWLGPKRLSVTNFKGPVQFENSLVAGITVEFH
jgi:hypothetical protein